MMNTTWTQDENRILVHKVNANLGSTGQVQWRSISLMPHRTTAGMQSQWSRHLKPLYKFNGKSYVLKNPNLFDKVTPIFDVENAKKTPQNASAGILPKRVVVKKSFLWGAFKFERYE
tara:strand:- start:4 stop:354 length:351 start_codon:yes stop_codon:yes gene_type:complete